MLSFRPPLCNVSSSRHFFIVLMNKSLFHDVNYENTLFIVF